ncbi:PAS domain-containing protein [Alicyclobacillus ferrooxydans]|uniref:PAS domain-containing protein n=1 Tax=Alicyclobacillus ferrooxydans TaxID=471514 RepID=UPI0006D5AE4B|nr:PAS domain-containing protein [Alicyclobacillus ferrooxydans]
MNIQSALSSDTFFSIVDSLSDAVVVVDSGEHILYWNQSAETIFGYSDTEMLGQPVSRVISVTKLGGHKAQIETVAYDRDKRKFPVLVSLMPLDGAQTALVIRDIRDRKTSEYRLERSQQLGQVGTWERDIRSGRLYWSEEMFRICGLEPREYLLVREFLDKCVHPGDVEKVRQSMNNADSGTVYDVQYRVVRPDGEVRWVHARGELEVEGDTLRSVLGCIKDITAYTQSLEDLKRSKDNLKLAQRLAKLGHWDWDVAKNDLFWSDETCTIMGRHPSDFGGTYEGFLSLVHPDDRAAVHQSILRALQGLELDFEYRILRPDGESCTLHVVGQAYFDSAGEPLRLFGTCQDITEKQKTDEMLIRSEKLAVLGQLAAGFAHEIRNALTVVQGFMQLLNYKAGDTERRYCGIMMTELYRISNIVDELLVLAKPQVYVTKPIVIEGLIHEVLALLGAQTLLHNVEFRSELHYETVVNCEPNQLKQVLVNVVKNAIEAMTNGGTITLRTEQTGEFAEIQVVDQGVGISQDTINRLGEPFYTTKDGGTGLGLMVSQKIIQAHRGRIDISSEVGVGTTVTIILPMQPNPV